MYCHNVIDPNCHVFFFWLHFPFPVRSSSFSKQITFVATGQEKNNCGLCPKTEQHGPKSRWRVEVCFVYLADKGRILVLLHGLVQHNILQKSFGFDPVFWKKLNFEALHALQTE